jgi:LPXTG-site transpeptidase (sortase) family protein
MEKKHNGWNKFSRDNVKLLIGLLGTLLLIGLIILPSLVSSAQWISQLVGDQYLPIVLNSGQIGPTSAFTPSPTNTLTGPEKTGTAAPSPTITLTPSPTFTGTLTPIAYFSKTVSGSPAKVNEGMTFTIKVGNTGTGPNGNNLVSDSFPSDIDVISVTSTKGTATKLSHSFTVAIGTVSPGEVVTITAVVKVNSSLTRTETRTNVATLTSDLTAKNASASYRVTYQSLPGTGELPLNWRGENITLLPLITGIIALLVGIALLLAIWRAQAHEQSSKLWITLAGVLLILIGFIVVVSGSGIFGSSGLMSDYVMTPTYNSSIAQQPLIEPSATILPHQPASAFSTPDSYVPVVTLPDFPIPSPVITVTPQPGEPEPDTSAITRIVIPALTLDTQVKYVPFDGVTWMITGLRQEIAWMGDTSWPGLGGNTGLAGHVTVAGMGDGPFRHLDELPNGELVLLYTEQNIYTYQVRDSLVTDDGNMSVITPTDDAQITLITCVDWDEENHLYLNRLVVVADLVRTEPLAFSRIP